MTPTALFITAALGHVLAVTSPGPDFAIVLRQTLAHGRAAGLRTAAGIATGIVFHVGYALFGLGYALQAWPWLSDALRYAGALFLLWMGLNALRSQPVPEVRINPAAPVAAGSYRIGLATNLLNPKATLFFVALCSALVTANPPWALRLGLAAWIVLTTLCWFSLVAVLLGHPRLRQKLTRHAHWIDRAMGAILVLLALLMLLR